MKASPASRNRRHDTRGFTLIEVIVALGLLATVAAASTQTLIAARRIEAEMKRWRQAQLLATDAIELARAGREAEARSAPDGWRRVVDVHPGALPGLVVIDVEVRPTTLSNPVVRLSTWLWRP